MLEFGIAVFDIDLKPADDTAPQDAINLVALYGPYSSTSAAQDYMAFLEDDYRERYDGRYSEGRYEFKLQIMPLQSAPVLKDGWL